MDTLQAVQPIIDEFYQAINLHQLSRSAELVAQLAAHAQTQPALMPWYRHYHAILITEREKDWAQTEQIFAEILRATPPVEPLLRGKTLFELGICLHYQGRWLEAVRAYEASLPILAAAGGVAVLLLVGLPLTWGVWNTVEKALVLLR